MSYLLILLLISLVSLTHSRTPFNSYTTLQGHPIKEKFHSLTIGKYGPIVLQDRQLLETLGQFDRERIPERVVHPRGTGAYGYFQVTSLAVTKYTTASIFSHLGKITPIFARFSTATGLKGTPETIRSIKGFAVKFYTDEGNWDLTALSIPVFLLRDARRFVNLVHSGVDPKTGLPSLNYFWDFVAFNPESLFAFTALYTDLGTPFSFRFINAAALNTFILIEKTNEPVFCRFHLISRQGIRNRTLEESIEISSFDPYFLSEDLITSINRGNFPSWILMVQIMTMAQAAKFEYNAVDPTKIWPHDQFPLIEVGNLVFDRIQDNFFRDVEQAAFDPGNLVPGIEPSSDRVLNGRIFSYLDTQRYRLGVNFPRLPVNHPKVAIVADDLRDGTGCFFFNGGSRPSYLPNSFSSSKNSVANEILPITIERAQLGRFNNLQDDNFSQLGIYLSSLAKQDVANLIKNLANDLCPVEKAIVNQIVAYYKEANAAFGERLREAILSCPPQPKSP